MPGPEMMHASPKHFSTHLAQERGFGKVGADGVEQEWRSPIRARKAAEGLGKERGTQEQEEKRGLLRP